MKQEGKDWLTWRKIGSSDCPVIMGHSPYKTPYKLWCEKMGEQQDRQTDSMSFGKTWEEHLRQQFLLKTNINVMPICKESSEYEWMTTSLDGLSEHGDIFVEIKVNNAVNHSLAASGKPIDHHIDQMHHQHIVLGGKAKGYYFSAHPIKKDGKLTHFDTEIVPFEPDEKHCANIIEKEEAFWNSLKNIQPPEMTDDDYEKISDEEILHMLSEYSMLNEDIKEKEERAEALKKDIILRAGTRNAIAGGFKIQKISRLGAVDYSRIPELKGIDLAAYRKPIINSWRISGK